MKKILFILPFLLLFSCTVQKRKYQNGYYVDWHSKNANKAKNDLAENTHDKTIKKNKQPEIILVTGDAPEEVIASSENELLLATNKKPINIFSRLLTDTCDVILFKDGSEIKGKILEVTSNEVKYKRCDTPDGPTYISRKSELFMIKYANGTREVIKSDEPPRQTEKPNYESKKYQKTTKYRQVDPLAIVALIFGILAVVFGNLALSLLMAGAGAGIFFLLPLLAALIAVISGKIALKHIRENSDIYKGRGMAMPGFIMGLVVLGIYAILLTFVLLIILTI